MRSRGVFPTGFPSIRTQALSGRERNISFAASVPALASRALRLATTPSSVERAGKCAEAGFSPVEIPGSIFGFCIRVTVTPAVETAPAYSATACAAASGGLKQTTRISPTIARHHLATAEPSVVSCACLPPVTGIVKSGLLTKVSIFDCPERGQYTPTGLFANHNRALQTRARHGGSLGSGFRIESAAGLDSFPQRCRGRLGIHRGCSLVFLMRVMGSNYLSI